MSATGLHNLDRAVHVVTKWIGETAEALHTDDKQEAFHALRGLLLALRSQLPDHESADFAAQLPLVLRGVYFDGWRPNGGHIDRSVETFYEQILSAFPNPSIVDPERIAKAAFQTLERHVSAGEISDVKHNLPDRIRRIFD